MPKVFSGVLFLFLFVTLVLLSGCVDEKESVQQKINDANYCETKDDCVLVGSKCPFGCYIYVNEDESEEISEIVSDFESKCAYGCLACNEVACFDGKCLSNC